jgi:hypothetical protein
MSNLLSTPQGIDAVREATLDALRRRIRRYFDTNTVEMFDAWLADGKPVPGLPELQRVLQQLNDDIDQEVLDLRELLDYYTAMGGPVPPHAATHNAGGADVLAVDAAAASGSYRTIGTGALQACSGADARLSDARTPTAHASSHNAGGGDAMTIDAAAVTGSLRTIGTGALQACSGADARLSDARTPTSHETTHRNGGGDTIKIDDLGPGDDNTDLNSSTTKHGLLPKLDNVLTNFLNGQGGWSAPASSSPLQGEAYINGGATATINETANTPILVRGFTAGTLSGWTYVAGTAGAITAYANYGGTVPGTVRVTSAAHGLLTGDIISIRGCTNYLGIFAITKIDNNSFYIFDTWVADDGASDWDKGAYLLAGASAAGNYQMSYGWSANITIFQASSLTCRVYVNATACLKCATKLHLGTDGECKSTGNGSTLTIANGDRVSFSVSCSNAAADPVFQYFNLRVVKS